MVAQTAEQVSAAKRARDQANIEELQAMAKRAASAKTAAEYTWEAQLNSWLCEAAEDKQDKAVLKQAAEAGAAAAKQATVLDAKSSDAFRLRGSLLGQVIAQGGALAGMRFGGESANALDQAIALDPKSAAAYTDRAIGYLFTPAMFGGSHSKAIQLLQKAVSLDPKYDTAHIWLAQAYLMDKKPDSALGEAEIAQRLNPNRAFTQYTVKQAEAAKKKG